MTRLLLVGLGGAIGSMGRYGVGVLLTPPGSRARLVGPTLVVNIVGCFVIGWLAGISEGRVALSEDARVFLFAGVLGGFTTYSAFGLETFQWWRAGAPGTAALNVAVQLLAGALAVWCGHRIGA